MVATIRARCASTSATGGGAGLGGCDRRCPTTRASGSRESGRLCRAPAAPGAARARRCQAVRTISLGRPPLSLAAAAELDRGVPSPLRPYHRSRLRKPPGRTRCPRRQRSANANPPQRARRRFLVGATAAQIPDRSESVTAALNASSSTSAGVRQYVIDDLVANAERARPAGGEQGSRASRGRVAPAVVSRQVICVAAVRRLELEARRPRRATRPRSAR